VILAGRNGDAGWQTVPVSSDVVTAPARGAAVVDLGAIRSNVRRLREVAGAAQVMAVVKADAYGHGLTASAQAAVEGGAGWLGVAFLEEALALRAAGLQVPILAWLITPGERLDAAIEAGIDLSAAAPWAVAEIAQGARQAGAPARLHLKVDTGLSRGGATAADWPELVAAALAAQAEGVVQVVGLWSHLVHGDDPTHPTTGTQLEAFKAAVSIAEHAGVTPEVRHLANSGATLCVPSTHFDLVRTGIATFGLTPAPRVASAAEFGLRPAMTLTGRLALTKQVVAGTGVSYGHRYRTPAATTLGLVPLGYADGIPRTAANSAEVLVRSGDSGVGRRLRIAGTVCMDQFVVDLGAEGSEVARAGDEVVLFGPGDDGEPTVQDWADALDTIGYEIVTRVGYRVPRVFVG
jgi:alanine racemase